MKVCGFCGASGAGKTTLIEGVLRALRAAGQRVSVVKHAGQFEQVRLLAVLAADGIGPAVHVDVELSHASGLLRHGPVAERGLDLGYGAAQRG